MCAVRREPLGLALAPAGSKWDILHVQVGYPACASGISCMCKWDISLRLALAPAGSAQSSSLTMR